MATNYEVALVAAGFFVFVTFAFAAFLVAVVVVASPAKATATVAVRKDKPSMRVINFFILCGSP
jgi:hypothetical protein